MPTQGRPRKVSGQSTTTRLFIDDRREVVTLSANEKKHASDVIRELVHEALRARRFRSFDRDDGGNSIRNIHRKVIPEGDNPMITELAALRQTIETLPTRIGAELRPIITSASPIEQAIWTLASQMFSHVMISEHIAKVIATVEMRKDNLTPDEVKKQLASQNQAGALQAKTITEKILDQYKPLAAPADANRERDGAK
jgi:hypothetical protein